MPLRVLCITAHPDDESGGFAGALLEARKVGAETRVLCLTEGRAASNRGSAQSGDELAAMRRVEFAKACEILEVTHGEVLRFPDGALANEDFYTVVTLLVERIRRFRPQIVLTFGPDGGPNLHRDHTMAGLFATAAFHWSGRSLFAPEQLEPAPGAALSIYAPQKLYYVTTHFTFTRFSAEAAVAPRTPASLTLLLSDLQATKREALGVHATQDVLTRAHDVFEKYGHEEHYLLVSARRPELMGKETSLFEGIEED